MAGAYSVALFAGFTVTAYVLHRRVAASGAPRPPLLRSPGVWAHARLVTACVPAGLLAYGAARVVDTGGAGLGDFAAAGAGVLVLFLVVALLARPLRLTEVSTALGAVRGRLRRG